MSEATPASETATIYVAPRHLERSSEPSHTVVWHRSQGCPYLESCDPRSRDWVYQIQAGASECRACRGFVGR